MPDLERKHVSRLVPKNPLVLTICLVMVAMVNSATNGYQSSMINGLNILPGYTEYFRLTTQTTSLQTGAAWIGSFLSCFLMQPLADKYGRKQTLLFSIIMIAPGIILESAAQNIAMFTVGRIIVGLAAELGTAAAPTLISEIVPASKRGLVLGIEYSCFGVGSLLSAGINDGMQSINSSWCWRIPSIIQVVPALIALCVLPFVPESPRWLLANGHREHAKEVLVIAQGNSDPDSPLALGLLQQIEETIAMEESAKNPWMELFSTPSHRKRVGALVTFSLTTELVGNFVISYYLGTILTNAGITSSRTQLEINVTLSCWALVSGFLGSSVIDRIGRKRQTMGTVVGISIMLYLLGGLSHKYADSNDKFGIYGTIACIFLASGLYAFTLTPMTAVYPSEVFEYKLRATGVALTRFINMGLGLMGSFTWELALANIGWKFYIINASYNFVFVGLIWYFWVETGRIPLEEIAMAWGDPPQSLVAVEQEVAEKGNDSGADPNFHGAMEV